MICEFSGSNTCSLPNCVDPTILILGVPVLVTGKIKKGDRLISAGDGLAKAATKHELTAFNVIGRALESSSDTGIKLVNCAVRTNN